MKFKLSVIAAAVLVGASQLALPGPAAAAPFAPLPSGRMVQAQGPDDAIVQKVRYRHHHYYGHGDGGAVAAGAIMGLALGAIIASQAAQYNRSVDWCMRRYRSYDPASHTWVDYHGRLHYCP